MAEIEIHQVCYNEQTCRNCQWPRYYNEKLTPFFENEVIIDLVTRKGISGDYFGVFSHKIQRKTLFKEQILGEKLRLTPESLEKVITFHNKDFFAFEKRRRKTDIWASAERVHRGIRKMTNDLIKPMGYTIPYVIDRAVLLNHFVARKEIYERYVDEMLLPVMKKMGWKSFRDWDANPVLDRDSRYKNPLRDFTPELGYNHYPYHPFILERLPSVWLHYNQDITFKQIF